ncbi:unnamed protein product [Dicrocoelium dendriticum]|nr:unnamed protein product [Dicrocoelium dendriticum]
MYTFFTELINYVHITSFELILHVISILISSVFLALHTEGASVKGTFDRETSLWFVFLPLWAADVVTAYFNFLVYSRHVLFYKHCRHCIGRSGLPVHHFNQPRWSRFVGQLFYSLLCSLCLFLFKLLLYQKLTRPEQSTLSYGVVFLPLVCFMHLLLVSIFVTLCSSCCP